MNIVFGDVIDSLDNRFMCLELDTFRDVATGNLHTAWCVVANVPLADLPIAHHLRQAHQDLMQDYRQRKWSRCLEAMTGLHGRWNGELDSFYDILAQRVTDLQQQDLPDDWDGIIARIMPDAPATTAQPVAATYDSADLR